MAIRWEYLSAEGAGLGDSNIPQEFYYDNSKATLSHLGRQGWELVNLVYSMNHIVVGAIFKRPLP